MLLCKAKGWYLPFGFVQQNGSLYLCIPTLVVWLAVGVGRVRFVNYFLYDDNRQH